jgi:N-acetylmuramoyl-L-alanine amidase
MTGRSLLLFPLFLLLAGTGTALLSGSPAAEKARVEWRAGSEIRSGSIQLVREEGVPYGAIDELGRLLGLPVAYDNAREKLLLTLPACRLSFSARNSFVAVADPKSGALQSVFHLPQEVRRTAGAFFASLPALAQLLTGAWDQPVTYDARTALLRVGENGTGDAEHRDMAAAYDITGCSVESRKNGTLIRIHAKRDLKNFESTLTANGDLLVSIPNATADAAGIGQTPTGGEIERISVEKKNRGVQILFSLGGDVESSDITKDPSTHDLIVALYRAANVDSIYAAEMQSRKKKIDQKKARWKLDTIVLDAGHGGKDPGTIGVTGVKEKNVALGIVLKLGKLIQSGMKGVRVVYTRSTDTFIELYRRGQMANEDAGKLFISIHCNATPQKPSNAHGFEVYLLRPGRTDEAIRVAELENSVVRLEKDYEKRYAKLTNENFILINMAQSSYMKYSERFAELLQTGVREKGSMKSNGVKQAGFYVLVGASMPSVLIETGYLSNAKEEKALASQAGQQHLAELILRALQTYIREYDKTLE